MGSLVGTRIGVYEIIDAIGAGGMGEVYRARDARLNRAVALKVLPESFASDPDRLARFKREAQMLASLNHPNIAAIYGLEEATPSTAARPATLQALVLELVEGPTLADVIANGPIALNDSLNLARQIADALDAAHERGIIHRDLKPANIKLRPDGAVKVLDFGLAKAIMEGHASGAGHAHGAQMSAFQTITSPAMTQHGVIVGTAAYMSPEQAKGRAADKRSDVWAFGCVLYEMLTGKRAFEGEDVADTLAFVLTRPVEWDALPADAPPAIGKLLRRCLEKDRKKRLADIADARLEIDEALALPGAATAQREDVRQTTAERVTRLGRLKWALIGAAVGMTSAAGGYFVSTALQVPPPVSAYRFDVDEPPEAPFAPLPAFMSVSPDGQNVAFVTGTNAGEFRLWVRPLNSFTPRLLVGTEPVGPPLWSPDSRAIAYRSSNRGSGPLRKVDLRGGAPITLASQALGVGAWGADGTILFQGADRRVYRVADTGGDAVAVTTLDPSLKETGHVPRFFLPDGRRFAFVNQYGVTSSSSLFIGSLDDGSRVKVIDGGSHAQLVDDVLVFHRDGTVMAQRFDATTGRVRGDAMPVVENVRFGPAAASFSVSATGVLAYRIVDRSEARGLAWKDLAGNPWSPPAAGGSASLSIDGVTAGVRQPSLSPDGQQLAVVRRTAMEREDIHLVDLARGIPIRLTRDEASTSPMWSADGARLAYFSARAQAPGVYVRTLASNAEELVHATSRPMNPTAWSPDGKVLLVAYTSENNPEVWALPLTGDRKPFALVKTGFPAGFASFSPDGRWFAYCEGDSEGDQVYAQPFPNGRRVRISSTSGAAPQWGADGKRLVYSTNDDQLMMVDVAVEGGVLRPGPPRPLFRSTATFNHRSVVFDARRDRIMVRDADETQRSTIQVVLNWLDEVKGALR
jgi:Tol biopolymer transport system component